MTHPRTGPPERSNGGPETKTAATDITLTATTTGLIAVLILPRQVSDVDLEIKLLSLITDPKVMALAAESGVTVEIFEQPLRQAVFHYAMDHRKQTGQPLTAVALEHEFPGVGLINDVEEDADYLIDALLKRCTTNGLQDALRAAARDCFDDPLGAAKVLAETVQGILKSAGRLGAGPGPMFESDVSDELRKLRVRDEAKRRFAIGKTGATDIFTHTVLADIPLFAPEKTFRIQNLLPAEGSMVVNAQHKKGKTTLVINVAHSLITGQDFLGAFRVHPISGRVGMINYEVSSEQFGRWARDAGVPEDRLVKINVRGKRNPFAHPEDLKILGEVLRASEVETLIVDPFGNAYTGTNQDSSGEVGAWLAELNRFAGSVVGVADLILTVHSGWNQERARGSSTLGDWPDSIVYLTRSCGPPDVMCRWMRTGWTMTQSPGGSRCQALEDGGALTASEPGKTSPVGSLSRCARRSSKTLEHLRTRSSSWCGKCPRTVLSPTHSRILR